MSESRRRFRGVAAKLSIALLVVNLVALAIVYSVTVPFLAKRLVAAREAALLRDAQYQQTIYKNAPFDPEFASNASAASDARATVLTPLDPPSGEVLSVTQDSRSGRSAALIEDDPVARRAATTRSTVRGACRVATSATPRWRCRSRRTVRLASLGVPSRRVA